jgi:hypothetical protein
MDNKKLLMYVHHLRSVNQTQFVTMNTHKKRHLMESAYHTLRAYTDFCKPKQQYKSFWLHWLTVKTKMYHYIERKTTSYQPSFTLQNNEWEIQRANMADSNCSSQHMKHFHMHPVYIGSVPRHIYCSFSIPGSEKGFPYIVIQTQAWNCDL